MEDASIGDLFVATLTLLFLSAYFSSSETAMMSLNRYRLEHLARERHKGARKARRLLRRPDRLLGAILLGNNVVNFLAASIATVIGLRLLGDLGPVVAPFVTTAVFLVFAEVAPKTVAARFPEKIAFPSSYILIWVQRLSYPFVVAVNFISNALLRPFGIRDDEAQLDGLSVAELRTVVNEGTNIRRHGQNMLLGVLDLEDVTVDDIMVPRAEIAGIDIEDELDDIEEALTSAQHTRLVVYRGDVNEVIGILHTRDLARYFIEEERTKASLMQETREPYFVPEFTPLSTQLVNFQKYQGRLGLVVDEYGDLKGIITLEDILEEIVGEFTTDIMDAVGDIHEDDQGELLIDGTATIRDVNRSLGWELPVDGPKTLSGLIVEHLELIPDVPVSIQIDQYRIEVVHIQDNIIRRARVSEVEDWKKADEPDE